jgi:hypothetical protein
MKLITYIIVFFYSVSSFAQTREQVLEKVTNQYSSAKDLQFTTTYNLYKTPDGTKVYQTYKGIYNKNKSNDIYLKIGETEFFSTKKINAKISHKEQVVQISNPSVTIQQQEYDMQKLLSFFKKGSFKDKGTFWEIELLAQPFSELPYSKLILHVGKDYFLQKQIFYYSTGINFSEDYRTPSINYPRLEIIYSKATRNPVPPTRFDTSAYFTIAKKIQLSSKYAKYELIDQR